MSHLKGEASASLDSQSLESTTRELNHVRHALDQSAIVAITDRNGTIVHVNEKFCQISQYSQEELLGNTHRIVNSGYHTAEFFNLLWETISSGKIWEGEIRNRAKGGSYYWVNTTIVPFLDEFGTPYQYVSIRYEVTQRKIAEEQLRIYAEKLERSNRELQDLWDSTFEGIVVHDHRGIILDINRVGALIFHGVPSKMVGTSLFAYLSEESLSLGAGLLHSSGPVSYEMKGREQEGGALHLELSGKPFQHQGSSARLTAIRDVTSRKQLEAQILMQDRLASIGLLASSLAHEIGTPLGVIRGRAEYLGIQTQKNPQIKKNVTIIVSQIDRVAGLIRSLLNLARGDEGHPTGEVNLSQIVEEVLDLMGYELRKNSIEIYNSLITPIPLHVRADAQPLHQVLLNLLVNSVHAIEAAKNSLSESQRVRSHWIRISTQEFDDRCVLSLEDSGCGISEKNLKNLFKPFFTTRGVGLGTGLGLATSYRIVESWGGRIQVESQEGVGTTFRISFPRGL